jgi:DNA-binding Lrp family transcriptional regulator
MLIFIILMTLVSNMDNLDQKLLALLQDNARTATTELARRLGVSRSTIQSRLKRLESQNIIEGYTVKLHDEYEKNSLMAHVLIEATQKLSGQTFVALGKLTQLTSLFAISGDYDMIAMVRASSPLELNQLLDRIADMPGVVRTNSSVILETKIRR